MSACWGCQELDIFSVHKTRSVKRATIALITGRIPGESFFFIPHLKAIEAGFLCQRKTAVEVDTENMHSPARSSGGQAKGGKANIDR